MPPPTDDAIESLRRSELPITRDRAYLDHATFGPLPTSHVRAATEALERAAREGSAGLGGTELLESLRAEAAKLFRCAPRNVCLLRSTGEGIGLVADGLDWRSGDEVVVHESEFEACLAPFLNLASRGVRIRAAAAPEEIAELIGRRTRAVAVSVVDRVTGARAPVDEMAERCREVGAWLALDGAQALGVLALDAPATATDVVSAHGYKFLLSGFGLAPTYCSDRAIAELRVPQAGWKNARVGREPGLSLAFGDTAERFEPTMSPIPVLAGMRESLRLLNGFEPEERERRALTAARSIADELSERGYEVSGDSAIVSARHPRLDAAEIAATLRRARVVCGQVDDRLRFSPHFYTSDEDVAALVASI
jgi:selenocysteine lyase/cysteine desulfurase